MTEKKQIKEQVAVHTYKRAVSQGEQPGIRRASADETSRGEQRYTARQAQNPEGQAAQPRQRYVTKPDMVESTAYDRFADRRDQRRKQRTKPPQSPELTPRTFAQTGVRASTGQMRALRQSQKKYDTPSGPIPKRRRATQRKGFIWRILSLFTILLIGALIVNFALTSSTFRIEQVSVVGTSNSTLVYSIQHMGIQGQNIFLIDVAALTTRINLLPQVAKTSLTKQWPNQLEVTITERIPVVLWQTSTGVYSVDSQGMVIARASETTGVAQLMTVIDTRNQNTGNSVIKPGVSLNKADIAFAMDLFARLPQVINQSSYTLRYDDTMPVSQEKPANSGMFVVESQDGWLAYLGGALDANPLENRLTELQAILSMAQEKHLKLATIDLRFDFRPVYTLKS